MEDGHSGNPTLAGRSLAVTPFGRAAAGGGTLTRSMYILANQLLSIPFLAGLLTPIVLLGVFVTSGKPRAVRLSGWLATGLAYWLMVHAFAVVLPGVVYIDFVDASLVGLALGWLGWIMLNKEGLNADKHRVLIYVGAAVVTGLLLGYVTPVVGLGGRLVSGFPCGGLGGLAAYLMALHVERYRDGRLFRAAAAVAGASMLLQIFGLLFWSVIR